MPRTAHRPAGPHRPATRLHTPPREVGGAGFRTPWPATAPELGEDPCQRLDLHLAQSARVEDYLLRGQTHFPADRTAAQQVLDAHPHARKLAMARKRFRTLATTRLAQLGADQFIDLGCGLPLPHWTLRLPKSAPDEIHRLAPPGATVVHVDRDPLVMTHARALLAAPAGSPVRVRHHQGDFTDPATVLRRTDVPIRTDRPVALLFFDVLHEIEAAAEVLAAYKAAVAPGSWLVVSHRSADTPVGRAAAAGHRTAGLPHVARSREEVAGLVEGWEPLGPGVVPLPHWSPSLGPDTPSSRRRDDAYAVIARKP
ncbi:SAM-dependent methyltransferase [Kitasatospora sp. NPDC006697]|uniref:SAM-dependent methyltransferase n=1 Tax=unclassified Kitasatospora TaxID=2633591 RepID=UPI0036D13D9C